MHVRFIKVPPTSLKTVSGREITVCHGDIYNVSAIEDNGDETVDITFFGHPHDGEVCQGINKEFLEPSHEPTVRRPSKLIVESDHMPIAKVEEEDGQ